MLRGELAVRVARRVTVRLPRKKEMMYRSPNAPNAREPVLVRGGPVCSRCVRRVRDVRHRPGIIEAPAAAIARRGFGFTSVSRGARAARETEREREGQEGGRMVRWHRGRARGTPPRYENKIRLAVARRRTR